MLAYGKLLCTISDSADFSTTLNVKLGATLSTTACSGTACDYSQLAANQATFPSVTAIDPFTANSIKLTGNFYTSGYTVSVSFAGIKSDSNTVSSSAIDATWLYGVPISETAATPVVMFQHTDGYTFKAKIDATLA